MIDILHEILALREELEKERRRVYGADEDMNEADFEYIKSRLKRELEEDRERKRLKGGC